MDFKEQMTHICSVIRPEISNAPGAKYAQDVFSAIEEWQKTGDTLKVSLCYWNFRGSRAAQSLCHMVLHATSVSQAALAAVISDAAMEAAEAATASEKKALERDMARRPYRDPEVFNRWDAAYRKAMADAQARMQAQLSILGLYRG